MPMVINIGGPLRPILIFTFLRICPGMAFVRLLHIQNPLSELTIAIGLSLTIDTIIAEIMIYSEIWSPKLGLAALICISTVGALLQLRHSPSHLNEFW